MPTLEIRVIENSDLLAKTFAEHFAHQAMQAVYQRGRFLAVLSGGGTPLKAYGLLAESPLRESVPWEHVHLFWGDERYVPHSDPQSNFWQAREALLDRVNIQVGNLHPVPTNLPPDEAALAYGQILHDYAEAGQMSACFDLVLLGLGNDGHTASLFPGQSALWRDRLVIATDGNYQDRPAIRITMTPLALNNALEVVYLVSGESKADALADSLGKTRDADRSPSQAINPTHGTLLWLVDKDAAKKLERY